MFRSIRLQSRTCLVWKATSNPWSRNSYERSDIPPTSNLMWILGYRAANATIASPTELSDHDCLVNTNDPIWHLVQDGHDVHLKVAEPVYSSNSYQTLRKAAIAGRGVALLPIRLVSDDLADGTLVSVIPDVDVPDRPLYALHSPGTQTTARVRLFLDFVSDWFRKQAPAQQAQHAKLAAVRSA